MTKPPRDFWASGLPYVPLPEATRVALAEERKARMAAMPKVDPLDPCGWGRAFRKVMPREHRLAEERHRALQAGSGDWLRVR
jgi:hypothetical protein